MGLVATRTYKIVRNHIKYCIDIELYELVYPIGIIIFPIGYSLFPIGYSLLAIPYWPCY